MFLKGNCQVFSVWKRSLAFYGQEKGHLKQIHHGSRKAQRKLHEIEKAFKELNQHNQQVESVSKSDDGMHLQIIVGKSNQIMSLKYDQDLEELVYKSPISGYQIYRYCND